VQMKATPRVRFAPSPTGYLHVGGARTALFNWLYARHEGGTFVLRIEDTDRERSSADMTEAILEGMAWLGLDWDEGPFHQADGAERHRADALRLLESGAAYRCFCSAEALQAKREAAGREYRYDRVCAAVGGGEAAARAAAGEPHTVRFRVPDEAVEWDDTVHGPTRFPPEAVEDFILLRTDGTATYNLAVVSDDVEMRITHVIRGDDHLANTPKQILLYRALGAGVPAFAHLPMILGPDGKRLSKRHGATAVGEYSEQGILPGALVNFLALLGWNPGDEREVMPLDELVASFTLERVNKKSAVFDPAKLEWMNGQYLARTPAEALLPLAAPHLAAAGLATEEEVAARREWFLALVELLKVRARTVPEVAEQARIFLANEVAYDPAATAKHWKDPAETAARLDAARRALEALSSWAPEEIEPVLRSAAESEGVGFGKLVHPLRLALTGTSASPGIDAVIALLGRDRVLARIDAARAHVLAGSGAREER
jgi:glutamyl-tRNA synthetase